MIQLSDLEERTARWTSVAEFTTLAIDTLQLGGGDSFFARFLPDGSLAIANGPAIFRLSRDGSFEGLIARSGDGPGEFRTILGLGVAGDGSLLASDHQTGRFTQLEPDGRVVRTIARLRPYTAGAEVAPFAVLGDGRVIAAPWQWQAARDPDADEPGALVRDQVTFVTYDTLGEVLDTVVTLPGLERGGGFVAPFARSAVYGGRGGDAWVAGISDSLDLVLYDGTAPTLHLVSPKVLTAISRHQRSLRDSAVAAKFGGSVGEAVVRRQAEIEASDSPPDIGGVLLDDSGRIWVGMYAMPGEPERRWYVFSPAGEPAGRLELPAFGDALLPLRTELLDIAGDRMALIRKSDDGEVYIEVRQISLSAAAPPPMTR